MKRFLCSYNPFHQIYKSLAFDLWQNLSYRLAYNIKSFTPGFHYGLIGQLDNELFASKNTNSNRRLHEQVMGLFQKLNAVFPLLRFDLVSNFHSTMNDIPDLSALRKNGCVAGIPIPFFKIALG